MFERHALDRLGNLVSYKCVEISSFTDFARVSCYVPMYLKELSIEIRMGCVALLSLCVSYLGSRLWNGASSGLWLLMNISWAVSCAPHLSLNRYKCQRLWRFLLHMCAMKKAFDWSVFLEGLAIADELAHSISIIECTDWSTVPTAYSRRPKR